MSSSVVNQSSRTAAISSDPLVSIIVRSFNEAWALQGTLLMLQVQEYRNWELIAIDSGSQDGSQELILEARPKRFVQIEPREYIPGKVLNTGMRLASSPSCIFLNADATPEDSRWLRPLAEAIGSPRVAACFGRQAPRPDCKPAFAAEYDRCFGARRKSGKWPHFFSMVSSGIRRDVWEKRGFREDLQYAEDDEYARWCKAQGYEIKYVPNSIVMHSHNYTPSQVWKRSFEDARAIGRAWEGGSQDFNWTRTVLAGALRDLSSDIVYLTRKWQFLCLPAVARCRWLQRRAKLAGFRQGWSETHKQRNLTA